MDLFSCGLVQAKDLDQKADLLFVRCSSSVLRTDACVFYLLFFHGPLSVRPFSFLSTL